MKNSGVDSTDRKPVAIKWSWFLMGCACLLVGWLYLGFVDLRTVATEVEETSDQTSLTSQGDGLEGELVTAE